MIRTGRQTNGAAPRRSSIINLPANTHHRLLHKQKRVSFGFPRPPPRLEANMEEPSSSPTVSTAPLELFLPLLLAPSTLTAASGIGRANWAGAKYVLPPLLP